MRSYEPRQRQLFENCPQNDERHLPEEVQEEVLRILTQWLLSLSIPARRERSDEQD